MEPTPTVSVILPTYNRAAMLAEAIASVRAQTFADWELIVVDDGSTDETEATVRALTREEPRLRYLRQPQGGVSKARNAGIKATQGRYVAFLDDDDMYLPEKLALQVAHLTQRPGVGFVYGQNEWVTREGKSLGVHPQQPAGNLRELFEHCAVTLQTVLCRRGLLTQAGGFDESLSIGEDYDLWLRLARLTKFEFMPRVLVRYRVHGANTCNDSIRLYEQRVIVLKRVSLDPARGITTGLKRRRLAINEYRLARLYRQQPDCLRAARHFVAALRYDPLVGVRMADPRPSGLDGVWVALKPYLAVIALSCLSVVSRKHRVVVQP